MPIVSKSLWRVGGLRGDEESWMTGRGFNVGRKLGVPRESYGLRAMRERVELLGGAIHFASRPARLRAECRGTTIEAHLPLQDSEIA
jgi:signal transduction histidine kinase